MITWFISLIRTPTPGEMLQSQLAQAQRSRVLYSASQEEAAAYVSMLDKRIVRITNELAKINSTTAQQENQ